MKIMKSKLRVGQDVYYDNNHGNTEMGKIKKLNTINELNMTIKGSEHLGRKYVSIITDQWINGWPKCVTVPMSTISPIL